MKAELVKIRDSFDPFKLTEMVEKKLLDTPMFDIDIVNSTFGSVKEGGFQRNHMFGCDLPPLPLPCC